METNINKQIVLSTIATIFLLSIVAINANGQSTTQNESTNVIKDEAGLDKITGYAYDNANMFNKISDITESCTTKVYIYGGVTQKCAQFNEDVNVAIKQILNKYQSMLYE